MATIKPCIECNENYYKESSEMKELCPSCAHNLYGYEQCNHLFKNGRCSICYQKQAFNIRNAHKEEFELIGSLLVNAYANLPDFPGRNEIPDYYNYLQNIGSITVNDSVELLVSVTDNQEIMGAVVFFKTMEFYGTDGIAPQQKKASGFRLLAVDKKFAGLGIGKQLCYACVDKTRKLGHKELIIHSTKFMRVARKMYAKMGFRRSEDLDFSKSDVYVYGYRLYL